MNKWRYLFFLLVCVSQIGCAALFTAEEYVLVDREVTVKMTFHGEIHSLPEPVKLRKVVLLGSGKIQNIEIHVRDKRDRWTPVKKVPGGIQFPFEIPLVLTAETDAIKIVRPSTTGSGRIEKVQFYIIADKGD